MIDRYSRPAMSKVWSEDHVFQLWLKVEVAAAQAWTELGVIPAADMARIRKKARFNRKRYDENFAQTRHDIISFTRAVAPSLGAESRWIHHGLTSNDVKDTALSLQMVEALDLLDGEVKALMKALRQRAEEFIDTLCMGRTHGVHAEPMSFGLKLALWWEEMRRHRRRLKEARLMAAVGMISGPVGSYASVPPRVEEIVCKELGLSPAPVSNQVIQRDRHAQFVQTLALIAATLEKIATEIRGLQRTEIREVEEPFGRPGYVSTGSSSMPHKRNPELSERVCGLARLVRGHAVTSLENVALWHERDISHSSAERIVLPDASLAVDYMLATMTGIVGGMKVNPERMMENVEMSRGLVFSERVMLALVEKGMDRKRAYEIVQRNAMTSWDQGDDFRTLVTTDPEVAALVTPRDLANMFDYGYYLRHVRYTFDRLGFRTKPPATRAHKKPADTIEVLEGGRSRTKAIRR
ncbi:MAG: adenylosuccinate lyase [SAR202 cluster bacterium]|nr:adenylosuccinate lyase [SAR202 cluster bacterium]